jgi:ABC-2 type transport system permease protein
MSENVGVVRRVRWSLTDTMLMAWRNVMYYYRNPYWLFFAIINPIIFTVLFVFVFGGAIGTPNGRYVDYLLPGMIIQTAIFSSLGSAINIADDMQKGIMDRFRSLPIARGTVLAGRTLSDIVRNLISVVLMVGVGYAVGYRFYGGFLDGVLAFGITIIVGYAFSWIATTIGLLVKTTQAAELAGFTWAFPLVFASSIFVPVETMPGWLEAFAKANPISTAADAARAYSLNTDPGLDPLITLLWCATIVVLFRTIAVWRFRTLA